MWRLVFGVEASGVPSPIVSIPVLAGARLISLGVLKEYRSRVCEQVEARPLVIVAEAIGRPSGFADPADNRES